MCSEVRGEECHRVVLGERDILARAAEEVERALRYQRPLSLLLILFDATGADARERLTRSVGCLVRIPDVVGYFGASGLLLVFPETGTSARIPAERVLGDVRRIDGSARGALVRCPNNGMDAAALIRAAREALSHSPSEVLCELQDNVEEMSFGEAAPRVIARDEKTKRLFALIRNLAKSDLPILILGETGVGKESAAAAVHFGSRYKDGPFIALNCAAVPATLLESELFGHEKGAFSGATAAKQGLVEAANGGTLFLDEVTEASPETQAKLLRLLETHRNRRIGAVHETTVNIRLVSAANRRIEDLLSDDGFRKDLYYRIGGARIEVPPLRERTEDILPLAAVFLTDALKGEGRGRAVPAFSEDVKRILRRHPWPGNVRELRHAMAYVAAIVDRDIVQAADLEFLASSSPNPHGPPDKQEPQSEGPAPYRTLAEEIAALEERRIREALIASNGARAKAAARIGMPLRTFVAKIKRYRLESVGLSSDNLKKA